MTHRQSSTAFSTLIASAIAALAIGALSATNASASIDREISEALAKETFDAAWELIHETHFDPEIGGLDWGAIRDELRPEAKAAQTSAELRGVLTSMLARLEHSHFGLLTGEVAGDLGGDDDDVAPGGSGHPGFEVRLHEGRFLIVGIDPDSPAERAGVRPGWTLQSIDGTSTGDLLDRLPAEMDRHARLHAIWQIIENRLRGPIDSAVALELFDEHDERMEINVQRAPLRGKPLSFGHLPTMHAWLDHERLRDETNEYEIGLIRFNVWMVPLAQPFAEAVDDLRDADGMIIDLRGNPGGVVGLIMGIGGHFVDERTPLGTMRTRETEMRVQANPQRVSPAGELVNPYDGPLVILVDELTGSASEIFAGGLQAIERAHIVGRRTMGAALPAMLTELPNGDVLMHAFADFTVARTEIQLEGRGVKPDEPVDLRRDDLLQGRDGDLEAALKWIRRELEESP